MEAFNKISAPSQAILNSFQAKKKLFNPFEFPDLINYLYYSHVYWCASHAWSNVIWDCWIIGPRARPRLKVPSPLHHTEFPHQRASPGPDGCCRIRSKELQTFHGIFRPQICFFKVRNWDRDQEIRRGKHTKLKPEKHGMWCSPRKQEMSIKTHFLWRTELFFLDYPAVICVIVDSPPSGKL